MRVTALKAAPARPQSSLRQEETQLLNQVVTRVLRVAQARVVPTSDLIVLPRLDVYGRCVNIARKARGYIEVKEDVA
jgi:hypothetical protein